MTLAHKEKSTQGYSSLTSCRSKITDGGFIAVHRQTSAHHAAKIRHRQVSSRTWRTGSKTQPEIKLDFIKPALRLPLTALLPICPERTRASHKCLDFCDFTAGSCTARGQGIPGFPAWIWDILSFSFFNQRYFFPSYMQG